MTGEWTPQRILQFVEKHHDRWNEHLSVAINAAIAAAWRKGHADAQSPALERIDKLQQQLAAKDKLIKQLKNEIKNPRD